MKSDDEITSIEVVLKLLSDVIIDEKQLHRFMECWGRRVRVESKGMLPDGGNVYTMMCVIRASSMLEFHVDIMPSFAKAAFAQGMIVIMAHASFVRRSPDIAYRSRSWRKVIPRRAQEEFSMFRQKERENLRKQGL